ncbi:MAG TPA: hypothetical protein VK155_04325 [Bacteroidales bacterium]|nr:hypothetical protein [Bacteroidales bacterium]
MKKPVFILLFFAATFVFSCEKMPVVNCSDCLDNEPIDAEITVKLDDSAMSADILVYEGDIEDNVVFRSINYTQLGDATVKVPINKKFTFAATYRYQFMSGTYTAVDSAFPRVKYDESQCENPCYYVYDNKVNLVIKYH